MTTREDQRMTSTRVFEHRAAVKRLQALIDLGVPGTRRTALMGYIEYHQRAAAAIEALEQAAEAPTVHVTTGQQAESSAFWPDAKEESYPGGREVRIDPPYDR